MRFVTPRFIAIWQLVGGLFTLATFLDATAIRTAPWPVRLLAWGMAAASVVAGAGLLRGRVWAVRLSMFVLGAQVISAQGGAWAYRLDIGPHLLLRWRAPFTLGLDLGLRGWLQLALGDGDLPAVVGVNLLAGAAFLRLVESRGEAADPVPAAARPEPMSVDHDPRA